MAAPPPSLRPTVPERAYAAATYAVPGLFLALFPLFGGFDTTVANLLLYIQMYMIFALGLNVVVGYTGLLDLGFVTFMAVGAVFTSLCLVFTVDTETGRWVFPVGTTQVVRGEHPLLFPGSYLLILAAAGLVCAVLGVLRGLPTLRLSGDYYAIVTLGLAEIVYLVLFNESWLSGGAFGIKLAADSRPSLLGRKLYWDEPAFYYLVFAVLALTVWLLSNLQFSRTGRSWAAIRLDETAARTSGVNVARQKLTAFAVSAFVGGVGGGLYAVWQGTVAVRNLDVWQSILVLCCLVLGGMGSLRGALLGTALLVTINEMTRYPIAGVKLPNEARYLVYGILIVLLMRFRPQGLWPLRTRRFALSGEELASVRALPSRLFGLDRPSSRSAP